MLLRGAMPSETHPQKPVGCLDRSLDKPPCCGCSKHWHGGRQARLTDMKEAIATPYYECEKDCFERTVGSAGISVAV